MKLLCFSDLHCDRAAAENLVLLSEKADILVGAGDFANQHRGISDTLDVLSQIKKPAVLVPGNGETFEELQAATKHWKSATVLHGSGVEIEGLAFWGVGGGIPITPFGDWSYDFDEDQARELLAGCPPGGVLVVHSPPINTVDHDSNGRIRGSVAIREMIERIKPKWVICGHIHSDWEKQAEIGVTRILNAGPRGVFVQ